jgi:hypothetical protein
MFVIYVGSNRIGLIEIMDAVNRGVANVFLTHGRKIFYSETVKESTMHANCKGVQRFNLHLESNEYCKCNLLHGNCDNQEHEV